MITGVNESYISKDTGPYGTETCKLKSLQILIKAMLSVIDDLNEHYYESSLFAESDVHNVIMSNLIFCKIVATEVYH